MNFLVSLLTLLTTFSQIVRAQEEPTIVSIQEGEKAPFNGILFTSDTAIRWGYTIATNEERLHLEIQKQVEICDLKIKAKDKYILTLQNELKEPSWYETKTFFFILGIALTTTVAIAIH